jgi:hypothetical protein
MSKAIKIKAITAFFASQGKRMTNLNRVTIEKLDEVIKKHNIPIEEEIEKIKEKQRKEKEEAEQREIEYKRKKEEIEKQKKKMKIRWAMLTDAMREECYVKMWELNYKSDPTEVEKHNQELKLMTDCLERASRLDGKTVVRIADNELLVSGVKVINGWLKTINIMEEDLVTMREENQQEFTYCNKNIIPMIKKMIKKIKTKKVRLIIVEDSEEEN